MIAQLDIYICKFDSSTVHFVVEAFRLGNTASLCACITIICLVSQNALRVTILMVVHAGVELCRARRSD